jgi:hypothetical protein
MPAALQGQAEACDAQTPAHGPDQSLGCWRSDDYTWRTSCRTADCQAVKVIAQYMLPDDLGGERVVHVEAFDNEHFQGAPVGTVRIDNFAARRGEYHTADLYLPPGEYYVRAYMTTEDDTSVPYSLGGMTLVGDEPVGVYGALSSAEMVRIAPRSQALFPDPVYVYLDKLFKKPGSEPDTDAHLRLNLSVSDPKLVPGGRKVEIQLRKSADLADAPVATFEMATDLFLIQGRAGKAEFVSPSLKEGDYTVFVFVDANGNGYAEDDELSALYSVNTQPAAVAVRKDRTETLALQLVSDAAPATAPAAADAGGDVATH